MGKTKVEWADYSWNPISGCSKTSDGCTNCYAEAMSRRFRKDWKPWTAANAAHNIRLHPERLTQPLHWRKPRKIFVCSMSDLFHEQVPPGFIDRVFAVMGAAKRHTFQVLTKRPHKMCDYLASYATRERTREIAKLMGMKVETDPFWIKADLWEWPLPNVWLGATIENQCAADERIPLLLQTAAAKRFVSCEPLLGPIDIRKYLEDTELWEPELGPPGFRSYKDAIDWVICGGESGPKARPMNPAWPRAIRDQCQEAGVAFHFKQWGTWAPAGSRGEYCCNPGASIHDLETMNRVGKKAAGRELDGRIWGEAP